MRLNILSPSAISPSTSITNGVEALEKVRKGIPLGDYPKPEDVADSVVFLASDRARMITGHSLRIDGGMCLPVGTRTWDEYYQSHKEAAKKRDP